MDRRLSVNEVLAGVWRHRFPLGVLSAAILVVGVAAALLWPSEYEATVVVRAQPQRPSEEMVPRTVSETVEQRLQTVRLELLGRPVLEQVIREMKLYPDVVESRGIEAAVERMRRDVSVRLEGEMAFELAYRGRDPQLVATVANRIPEVFLDQTARTRKEQAARATDLFGHELKVLRETVADWEKKIATFKVAHMGELPEQLESNMRGLERLTALMQTKSEELRAMEGRRSDLARARNALDSEAGRLQAAEDGLTRTLVAAQTSYTSDHPEVRRLSKELEGMRVQRLAAEGRMKAERMERARAAELVAQIQKEIANVRSEAKTYQERIDRTPRWAHELSVMQRDYEIARTKYQSLVSRKVEAELAQELEAKGAKSLLAVVSPAIVPGSPVRPDRFLGIFLSLLAALAIPLLIIVVSELRNDTVRGMRELKGQVSLPVLAVVPSMNGAGAARRVLLPAPKNEARTEEQ